MENNLNTFRILYIVKGILTLLFSLFFILYGSFGFIFMNAEEFANKSDLDFNPGILFIIFGSIGLLITITVGIVTLMTAKYLKELRNYNFIFAVAVINCLTGVLGILLGVFTLVELNKPHVKELFGKA